MFAGNFGNNQNNNGGGGGGNVGNANNDLFTWYTDIPVVSRTYLTLAISLSTACFMDILSPFSLYFNFELILNKGQFWRVLSSFLFFGQFSLDFLFHLYFVARYCRLLEEGPFRNRTADFVFMLLFGAFGMIACAYCFDTFARIKFLGHPLSFMMVYVWARWPENAHIRMSLFGIIPFSAPYLPWIILLFSLFIGNPIETDLLGIVVGHCYYFLDYVYPQVAEVRQWRIRKLLHTPVVLQYLCAGNWNLHHNQQAQNFVEVEENVNVEAEGDQQQQEQQQQQQQQPQQQAPGLVQVQE